MISRNQFFEWLTRPYEGGPHGLEIYLREPIQAMWSAIADFEGIIDHKSFLKKYLVLSVTCSIDKAVELALQRPDSMAYEPIILKGLNGQWRLLDMRVLVLAQSQLFALAKTAADAANRAKSQFLANMSHELRTPLNAILGFTQVMVHDSSLSTEQQQYLSIINLSGKHLLELINDILQMSKIEAGRSTLKNKSFDLYSFLENLKQMLQFKAVTKGLKFIFECYPGVPQYIQADEGKLREILINLLGNAIKFTEEGSIILRVRLGSKGEWGDGEMGRRGDTETRRRGDAETKKQFPIPNSQFPNNKQQTTNNQQPTTIHFEVEDTGPGIAPEEMDKLFTAFGQTETGRKLNQGTGLGLAISQTIVQLMGGKITVSSTPNQGTTFTFDIQVTLAEATEIETSQQTGKIISLAPNQPEYRILVVDDRPDSRLFLLELLKFIGFSVREAENGQEAIEIWSSYSPHLILMDMRMPVMNGYQATEQIKAKEREMQGCGDAGTWGRGDAGMRRWGDGKDKEDKDIPNSQFPIPNSQTTNNQQQTTNTIIIALTASVFEEEQTAVLSAGCDDFLSKPFPEQVLWEKIAQHLGVRYLYQDSVAKKKDQEISGEVMTTIDPSLDSHLSSMPREWRENLNQAAIKCLDHEIIQLVEQIPEIHSPLANTLSNWADNFLFDQVIEFIQRVQITA
ncbi:MAG: response regulator [Symploca sp. SIO2E6]|nr:response regulator [Symploca sp. SIO2E6]